MQNILRNALGMMRKKDFFFENPLGIEVCDEQHFTASLLYNFRRYIEGNQDKLFIHREIDNNRVLFQYNQVKSSHSFQKAVGKHGYDRAKEMFSELLNGDCGSVIPDLCYHDPSNIMHNHLVIEVKCNQASPYSIYHDFRKLRFYTDPSLLNFQTGIFLHVLPPNIDSITSVKNWASRCPRSVPAHTPRFDDLKNNKCLETPAPVIGASFYIWRIHNPTFDQDGFFNTDCIEEIEVMPHSFNDEFFR